jgi:hypothetical protein
MYEIHVLNFGIMKVVLRARYLCLYFILFSNFLQIGNRMYSCLTNLYQPQTEEQWLSYSTNLLLITSLMWHRVDSILVGLFLLLHPMSKTGTFEEPFRFFFVFFFLFLFFFFCYFLSSCIYFHLIFFSETPLENCAFHEMDIHGS